MSLTPLLLTSATASIFIGACLLFDALPWYGRRRIVKRLRPYAAASMGRRGVNAPAGEDWAAAARAALQWWQQTADRLMIALGVHEHLAVRLRAVRSSLTVGEFRLRQLGIGLLTVLAVGVLALAAAAPPVVGILAAGAFAAVAMLLVEQRVNQRVEERRRRAAQELPVLCEQLGMLLDAGYSVGGAIERVAQRANGVVAEELRQVAARIQQGAGVGQALDEWAMRARLEPVSRLAAVLALGDQPSEVGRLVTAEAEVQRREQHRELLAHLDRRAQQVWIPVTVATLLPGALLIGVPFSRALSGFLLP